MMHGAGKPSCRGQPLSSNVRRRKPTAPSAPLPMVVTAFDISLVVVALAGLYLLALGVVALLAPHMARPFLYGFAGSAAKHYLELGVRLVVGAAFVYAAPKKAWPLPASTLGWLLVATTVALCFVPWRLHRRFAERSVAQAAPYLRGIGVVSIGAGAAVLASLHVAGAA